MSNIVLPAVGQVSVDMIRDWLIQNEPLFMRKTDFERKFAVGSIVINTNGVNPADQGYPGDWVLVEDDVLLRSVTENAGVVMGDHTQPVPLSHHSHSITSLTMKCVLGARRISQEDEAYLDYLTLDVTGGVASSKCTITLILADYNYGWTGPLSTTITLDPKGNYKGDIPTFWIRYQHRDRRCDEEGNCKYHSVDGWVKVYTTLLAPNGQTFYSQILQRT